MDGDEEIGYIHFRQSRIGICGLAAVFKAVRDSGVADVKTVQEMLLQKVKEHNYVADPVADEYKVSIYREYRRFLGEDVEEVESDLSIKILGPGCPSCERLENEVIQVLQDLNLPVDVQHIRDAKEIARYKVMATPALVINGKLIASGRVPARSQLRDWLLKKPSG
ncbi:thioredoxin family protein [candidate division WOR-3 bacterium]|nr:thioredoxin family protein [candidate division WOR-3 bacterium]